MDNVEVLRAEVAKAKTVADEVKAVFDGLAKKLHDHPDEVKKRTEEWRARIGKFARKLKMQTEETKEFFQEIDKMFASGQVQDMDPEFVTDVNQISGQLSRKLWMHVDNVKVLYSMTWGEAADRTCTQYSMHEVQNHTAIQEAWNNLSKPMTYAERKKQDESAKMSYSFNGHVSEKTNGKPTQVGVMMKNAPRWAMIGCALFALDLWRVQWQFNFYDV